MSKSPGSQIVTVGGDVAGDVKLYGVSRSERRAPERELYDEDTRTLLRTVLSSLCQYLENPGDLLYLHLMVQTFREMTPKFHGIEPTLTRISPRIASGLSQLVRAVNIMPGYLNTQVEMKIGNGTNLRTDTVAIIAALRKEIEDGLTEHT